MTPARDAPRDVRICVLGDSLVAGVGDPKALGWVGRVAARTPESTGVSLTAYPLGVRGETTEEVVVRLPMETAPRFGRGDEHGVVLAVGAADARSGTEPARAAAALRFGLLATSARRLVVGPPPLGDREARGRAAELDAAFAALCGELDVPYLSTYAPLADHAPWLDQRLPDGVHPGQAGYGMLAYVVLHGGWYDWLRVTAPQPPRRPTIRR